MIWTRSNNQQLTSAPLVGWRWLDLLYIIFSTRGFESTLSDFSLPADALFALVSFWQMLKPSDG